MAEAAETVRATVTVLDMERVDEGRLLAFANVEIDLDGILIGLAGVRLIRRPGKLAVESPQYRRGGAWLPAVALPEELANAIATAVFAAYDEAAAPPACAPVRGKPSDAHADSPSEALAPPPAAGAGCWRR